MLHIIKTNPLDNNVFQRCVEALKQDDALLLIGDGVLIEKMPDFYESLSNITNLYVLETDLIAHGINNWCGTSINMDGVVELVVKHGSPQTW